MQKYKVLFHADAQTDIVSSYEWGCRVWGRERANQWIRQLRHTIRSRLASLPLSCPIAPESEEVGVEIRQLIMRRYRILFIVEKKTVTVLHLRGPYRGKTEPDEAK